VNREDCLALDAADPLAEYRLRFQLPSKRIYLDGNSLGALPHNVVEVLQHTVAAEWGESLIAGWNSHGWIDLPETVGEKIAPLLGAAPGQVIATDSTSVNIFKLLSAALELRPGRRRVLSSRTNFPTDLYMAQGLSQLLGESRCVLELAEDERLAEGITEEVAVVMLTHVDFRSGRMWNMADLTRRAHEAGAIVLWDLAHSAGAVPLALDDCEVDLAVGCGYKYLNGGPGAPAFVYVSARHQPMLRQPLTGWMGHRDPFEFSRRYQPADGMHRLLAGTPSVLAMRALETALDVFADVSMAAIRSKSLALMETFLELVDGYPELAELDLRSPRDADLRGSQLAFAHPDGYALMQALIAEGVVGDFREPDLLRFGFTPLYLRFVDVFDAVDTLRRVMAEGRFRAPEFRRRARVT
jgi:kynureninase